MRKTQNEQQTPKALPIPTWSEKTAGFKVADALFIALAILPLVAMMVIKVLVTPMTEGIAVSGALIYFKIPFVIQDLIISEVMVNSFCVVITILALCLYMTHGIRAGVKTRRAVMAEWAVEKLDGMVGDNMGEYFGGFPPFIGAILALSAISSLLSLLGLYPPTSDINITAGWAVLVFILITYYKSKCGPLQYAKSFGEPVKLLAPLNIISEVATPVSMAFRHYGNVLSGAVISVLLAAGLGGASNLVFGALPGILGDIPYLRIGIPAVLSLYFDLFSGCLQAYIFAMLTMLYVSGAFPADEYEARKRRKQQKLESKTSRAF